MVESTKFEVNIISGDQKVKKFKSKNTFLKWADEELKKWQRFIKLIDDTLLETQNQPAQTNHILKKCVDYIKAQQLQFITDFNKALKLADGGERDITLAAKHFNAQGCFTEFSERGSHLLKVVEIDPLKALFLFGYWHHECNFQEIFPFQNNLSAAGPLKHLRVAMNEAHVEAYLFDNQTLEKSESEHAAFIELKDEALALLEQQKLKIVMQAEEINRLKNNAKNDLKIIADNLDKRASETIANYQDQIFKQTETFKSQISEKTDTLKKHQKTFEEDIEKLKKDYEDGFSMKSPVDYWKRQYLSHRTSAVVWGAFFVYSITMLGFGSILVVDDFLLFIENHPIFDQSPYLTIFMISFPAFLIIWILRITSRNLLSSIGHMHDSNHRAVMAETFLALMYKELASDDDKILMLSALFQPLKSQADDGAPPNWYALLMEKAGKST